MSTTKKKNSAKEERPSNQSVIQFQKHRTPQVEDVPPPSNVRKEKHKSRHTKKESESEESEDEKQPESDTEDVAVPDVNDVHVKDGEDSDAKEGGSSDDDDDDSDDDDEYESNVDSDGDAPMPDKKESSSEEEEEKEEEEEEEEEKTKKHSKKRHRNGNSKKHSKSSVKKEEETTQETKQEEVKTEKKTSVVPMTSVAVKPVFATPNNLWKLPLKTSDEWMHALNDNATKRIDMLTNQIPEGKTNFPDEAMLMLSRMTGHNLHWLQYHDLQKRIICGPAKPKDYYNVGSQLPQNFYDPSIAQSALAWREVVWVSPLFCPAERFKIGQTIDTGIEGTFNQPMGDDNKRVAAKDAKYQVLMTNDRWHHLIANEDGCNLIFEGFWKQVDTLLKVVLRKFAGLGALTALDTKLEEARKKAKKKNKKFKMPDGVEKKVDYFIDQDWVKGKAKVGKLNDLHKTVSTGTSVHGKRQAKDDYTPPTEMFRKHMQYETQARKDKPSETILLRQKFPPVYRLRAASEVKKGETYKQAGPFIRIPDDQIHLTGNDALFAIFAISFYPESPYGAGIKLDLRALVWLNYISELRNMEPDTIVPCDPRVAFPMAGKYLGPPKVVESVPQMREDGTFSVDYVAIQQE